MPFPSALTLQRFLCACWSLYAGATCAAAHITAITPTQVPYGHATTLTVTVADAEPTTQLALVPGGAFESGVIPLAQAMFVFPLPMRGEVLVGSAQELLLAEINGELPVTRARLPLADARHFSASEEFVVFVDSGLLRIVNLQQPGTLLEHAPLPITSPVRDVALDQHAVYVLLVTGQVLTADVTQISPALRVLGELPSATERLVVQAGACYSTAPNDGLLISACDADGITTQGKFVTSGVIRDLSVADRVVYLADGPAGLTLVDVTDLAQPRLLGSNNKLGDAQRVALGAGRAVISNHGGEVFLLDITRSTLPLVMSTLRTETAPTAISWSDGDAWLATQRGAQRIDFHAETASVISDEGVNLGGSRRGYINDNILYVADWFSGLHLYDIGDPAHLRHIGNFHTPGSSKGVVVRDGIAFVGDDDHGVQILDVSNPAKPALLSNIPTPGLAYTMKLVGPLLYIADHRGGLHIADVSDVRAPRVLGSYDTPGKAWAVDVRGSFAFVADDASGLLILDVSDVHQPRLVGQFSPGGAAEDVRLRDQYAFVTFFDQGLFVVDISDPAAPRAVGQIAIPGNARGIDLQGNYAYVAAWEAGLQIVDISDLAHPRITGYYDTDGSTWGVNVRGDSAYLLDWWGGVKTVDIRTVQTPRLAARYHARAPIRDVVLTPRYALAASDHAGLQIYDIKNPLNPIWVTGVDLPAAALSVAYENDTGYVATNAGIALINLHDPFSADLSHSIAMPRAPRVVRTAGHRVFVLDDTGEVFELDKARRRLIPLEKSATDIWADATTLYVARGVHGINIFALDAEQPPVLAKIFRTSSEVEAVRAQGNIVVAALHNQTLAVFIQLNRNLRLRSLYPLRDALRDFQIIDNTLYVSTARDELLVLDLSDSAAPALHARYPATHHIERFAVRDGQVFFAGENKLTSLKLLPEVRFTRTTDTTFTATLPADEPLGSYDIAVLNAGRQIDLRHDAVRVTLKTGKKPQLSTEQFQRLLEQQKALRNGTR